MFHSASLQVPQERRAKQFAIWKGGRGFSFTFIRLVNAFLLLPGPLKSKCLWDKKKPSSKSAQNGGVDYSEFLHVVSLSLSPLFFSAPFLIVVLPGGALRPSFLFVPLSLSPWVHIFRS